MSIFALLALLLAVGCNISPKPEPPSDEPPKLNPEVVVSQEPVDSEPLPTLSGGAGAVDPPSGVVRITNLDSAADPDDAVVQADGSFSSSLELMPGDEVRLQIIAEQVRSEPFDFVVGFGKSAPMPAPRPLRGCLVLEPPTQLDLSRSQRVTVFNKCETDVRIDAPSLRRPAEGWLVGQGQTWPMVLASNDRATVTVEPPAGSVALEEVFFIEASDPQTDRRPITAFRDAE